MKEILVNVVAELIKHLNAIIGVLRTVLEGVVMVWTSSTILLGVEVLTTQVLYLENSFLGGIYRMNC